MRTANTIAMGLLMACGVLRAEVTDVGTSGFTVTHAVRTPASASTVFERMTRGVGIWWLTI